MSRGHVLAFFGVFLLCPPLALTQVSNKPASTNQEANEWTLRGRLVKNPHDKVAHERLCDLLRKQEKYRDLANERKAWLADNPDDSGEVIALDTVAIFWLNDDDVAIEATRKYLAALAPDDPMCGWANNFLGRELLRRRRFSEAILHLRKAVEKNSDFGDYWQALGNALLGAGQTDAGIDALRQALSVQPSSASIHESLASALEKSGDLLNAETEYKAASNLEKKDATRLVALAKLQIKRHKFADAKDTLDRALKMNQLELYAYLLRARIFELEGQNDKATVERKRADALLAEDMRKSKSTTKDNIRVPMAFFALGDSQEIVRLEEANESLLAGGDRLILFAAYIDLGRKDDALVQVTKLFSNYEENTARNNFLVAEGLRQVNLTGEAEKFYRKAYEMDPENTTYRYEFDAIRKLPAGK